MSVLTVIVAVTTSPTFMFTFGMLTAVIVGGELSTVVKLKVVSSEIPAKLLELVSSMAVEAI